MTDAPDPPPDARLLEMGRLAELGLQSAELVHELRQPLFAAKSLAQLLEKELLQAGPEQDRAREHLRLITQQLDQLETLMQRYGGATRRPEGDIRPVLLAPPVAAAVHTFGPRARSAGIDLQLELRDGRSRVQGDVVAIQQILGNLVHNAIDAARSQVQVVVDHLRVEVWDDGVGPKEGSTDSFFEPFYTTKPPGKGTGLGLSVARQLMRSFGGDLEMRRVGERTLLLASFQASPDAAGTNGATTDPP